MYVCISLLKWYITAQDSKDITYHNDSKHHVIVVDEKHELLFALRKLGGHSQDEVFHLTE